MKTLKKLLIVFTVFFYFTNHTFSEKDHSICNELNEKKQLFSTASKDTDCFTIQVKSFYDKEKANNFLQKLSNKNIPVDLKYDANDEAPEYRIRVGKFLNRSDAVAFANYWKWKNTRIVDEKNNNIDTLIQRAVFDNFSLQTEVLYAYASHQKPLFIIYQKKFGLEMAVHPSDLYIYRDSYEKRLLIENITGFIEKDQSIQFGKSVLLYRNFEGQPKSQFKDKYNQYAIKLKRTYEDLQNKCLEFNDGYDIRLTLLGELYLTTQQEVIFEKLGFDYTESNRLVAWKGATTIDQLLGNKQMVRIDSEQSQSYRGKQITAFSRKESLNQIEICVLFYQ